MINSRLMVSIALLGVAALGGTVVISSNLTPKNNNVYAQTTDYVISDIKLGAMWGEDEYVVASENSMKISPAILAFGEVLTNRV